MASFRKIWVSLQSAPHRLLFLGGICQGIVSMFWWLLELSGVRSSYFPTFVPAIPSVWAHAYLMIFNFFPFFIFGFLFTFFPNWLDSESIPPNGFLLTSYSFYLGTVLSGIGLFLGKPLLLLGVLIQALGWINGVYWLLRLLIPARSSEKSHLSLILFFVFTGGGSLILFGLWLLTDLPFWLVQSRLSGIWFSLLPLVVTMSYLLVPFFSKRNFKSELPPQPMWIFWVILAALGFHGGLEELGLKKLLWMDDVILVVFTLYLSIVWKIQKSSADKLLFMLHLSFAWLSIAGILDMIQSFIYFYSHGETLILGQAPLHSLTAGFFSSMVMGMLIRVSFGHSGMNVKPDAASWKIFLTFQCAPVLRVIADFFPGGSLLNKIGYEGSALFWIVAFSLWVAKYGFLLWNSGALPPVHRNE